MILQDGKNGQLVKRGPFPFVVQLRDIKTRELLPGRTIQDIGPKAVSFSGSRRISSSPFARTIVLTWWRCATAQGYPMVDNGTMLLDQVEIPHVNFLAGYASVDPETGKFNKPQHDKLAYGTMVYIRASESTGSTSL